ncbi:MAG: hypothetical protein JXQ73_02680 [Phycisphaerae bacterium]|nr:hypothetical protein [Phycisphaerae bacterium]
MTGKYAGAAKCKECHEEEHGDWLATHHAKALETLEAEGRGTDPDCVICHVVGFGEAGGYVSRQTTNSLAGVQCENCHGPGREHCDDEENEAKFPTKTISAKICGQCHTGCECHRGSTHPNYQLWKASTHGRVDPNVAAYFAAGEKLAECGPCHSGDYREVACIQGKTVDDNLLAGEDPNKMNGITCVICHNPHAKTANATAPIGDWDYQLRCRDLVACTPCNSADEACDPNRYNLCGQCHRSRGTTWQSTESKPHGSVQANVYTGEMPMPTGQENAPLVPNKASDHADVAVQCSTCHMYCENEEGASTPETGGHTYKAIMKGCGGTDCHESSLEAQAITITLQDTVQASLDDIAARLGDPKTWEYTEEGGPDAAGQAAISDVIKKVRFLYHYVLSDGSLGVHNPQYVKDMLAEADQLLTSILR